MRSPLIFFGDEMARLRFAAELALQYLRNQNRTCPYCKSEAVQVLGRKYVLLQAMRCDDCGLIFRYPKPETSASAEYYQVYEGVGVTELPNPAQLRQRMAERFRGPPSIGNDYSYRIELLKQLRPSGKLFEFGCSWGYGLWQFAEAGFEVAGFEISRKRADYGRREMRLKIATEKSDLICSPRSYDIVFSSHVLEHVADLRDDLDFVTSLLNESGLLMIFCPNGGGNSARKYGLRWGPFITEDHVNAITADFLMGALKSRGLSNIRCASDPYALPIAEWSSTPSDESLTGDELLIIAERK